jgi:hypothetical protein
MVGPQIKAPRQKNTAALGGPSVKREKEETMDISARVATWLELAVAPEWQRQRAQVKLHPVKGQEGRCFTLSMNDRWLCVGQGQLTVFRGRDAAQRFLKLVRIESAQDSEESPLDTVACDGSHYCLYADSGKGLTACRDCLHKGTAMAH